MKSEFNQYPGLTRVVDDINRCARERNEILKPVIERIQSGVSRKIDPDFSKRGPKRSA